MTVMLISKVVHGIVGSSRQVHTWMRDSGRLTHPDAATPDLGSEPPALVNLLLTRGKISRAAVLATVLDLAARKAVTLHQPDNDPRGTVVMATAPATDDLTAYERRVL